MGMDLPGKAAEALEKNWQEGFSIPCEGLYPFQWNWDSGFIAPGWAHLDMERAKMEFRSLLKVQWTNGFLPHIIFHNESDTYFPDPGVYDVKCSPYVSDSRTSGITQPAILGFFLLILIFSFTLPELYG